VSQPAPASPGRSGAADGAGGPDDPAGFAALVAQIAGASGFACGSYKEKCLRRRIGVRMRARGVHSYADYMRVLDRDPAEYGPLVDALTINVTKLFRNWEVYDAVARQAVPDLWARPDAPLRVWSAGCSSGEEPYSMAVLFHRHAESLGEGASVSRVRVLGTDIDRASLAAAERGARRSTRSRRCSTATPIRAATGSRRRASASSAPTSIERASRPPPRARTTRGLSPTRRPTSARATSP
jgi:chemotaxis methyl-accepting protein methylase